MLSFATGALEQVLPLRHGLAYRLVELFTLLVLAKKLFANEEHSYAKAVSLDVFVVALAWTYFLTILDRIAA